LDPATPLIPEQVHIVKGVRGQDLVFGCHSVGYLINKRSQLVLQLFLVSAKIEQADLSEMGKFAKQIIIDYGIASPGKVLPRNCVVSPLALARFSGVLLARSLFVHTFRNSLHDCINFGA